MSWPPNPEKQPDNNSQNQSNKPNNQPTGHEWRIIEKTMMASVEEQRKARRWSIFFKFLTFGYIILIFTIMGGRSCSNSGGSSDISMPDEPHIAVIDVNGVISANDEANSSDINKAINLAYENASVKAVVLRINSPGGSPVQSDEIWSNIMKQRKEHKDIKTYAIIGDIGASGAYYIASAADEIYVNPTSLVGSIGVILPNYDIRGLMEKTGIQGRTQKAGEYKDILSMGRPMSDFEKQHIESVLNSTHQTFINAVKEGRGDRLKNTEANKIFTGLFWSGSQSITLGLADEKGNLSTLKEKLELDTAYVYNNKDPMEKIFERFSMEMGKGFGSAMKSEMLKTEQTAELR